MACCGFMGRMAVAAAGTDLTGIGTDNRLARWDGTDTLQSSGWTLSDANVLTAGGNIDTSGWDITMSNGDVIGVQYIHDGNGDELIRFIADSSPVNYFNIGNRASGNGPYISAVGTDTNIDCVLEAKGSGRVVANNSSLLVSERLYITEQSAASTDNAGEGQVWIKNATPNEMWFTDDAGTDYPVSKPDYLYMTLSADQTGTLTPGTSRVEFDESSARGSLSLDTVTNVGQVTGLKAGRTYRLTGRAKTIGTSARLNCQWYDVTGTAYIGSESSLYAPEYASSGNGNTELAEAIFTPSSDSTVELRVVDASPTTVDLESTGQNGRVSYAIIQEF